MQTDPGPAEHGEQARKADRLAFVLESVIRRRNSGEKIPDKQVIQSHPELMPELGARLKALRRVEQAERRARSEAECDGSLKPPSRNARFQTPPDDLFPGYEFADEIHYGGQGEVYRAIQKGTRRPVAIKVMREGLLARPEEHARFQREVRILAQLNHPGIVTVHESGVAGGHLYLVMDYITGRPLDVYMAMREPSIRETLGLFAGICDAVNAAHLQGIIHRDLKPTNILVDSDGQPHVLDFGLAKVTPDHLFDDSSPAVVTVTGQFMGSLPWASPEQAEGLPACIDLRTDVYSLGVILYHMLTGRFPYQITGGMRDVLDNILRASPTRPSAVRRQIDDEVQTIVLKCLSKERDRRYQSAGELARDVRHYLAGEAIEAKRDSGWYTLRKHLHRYRLPVAVVAAWVLFVTLALAISLALWRQAANQRDQAVAARIEARSAQAAESRQRQRAEDARAHAEDRELIARRHQYAAHMNAALQAWKDGDARRVLELLDANRPMAGQKDLRGFEWYHLLKRCRQDLITLRAHAGRVNSIAFSPSGGNLATASDDQTVIVWDVATFAQRACLRGHEGPVTCVAFSPDGRTLATGGRDGTARLWDPQTGLQRTLLDGQAGPISSAAFSPDGQTLATGAGDVELSSSGNMTKGPGGTAVKLWNVATGRCGATLTGHKRPVLCAAFSPKTGLLATGDGQVFAGGEVRLWDPVAGRQVGALTGYGDEVYSVAFSPDGSHLVTGGREETAKEWNLATRQVERTLGRFHLGVPFVVYSPDGHALATCSGGMVTLWDMRTGVESGALVGHIARVSSAAFSPDGRLLATGSWDNTVKVWNPSLAGGFVAFRGHSNDVRTLAFSPDGKTLATGSFDACVKLWDPVTRRERANLKGHSFFIESVAFSPDGRTLASASQDRSVILWDSGTAQARSTARGDMQFGATVFTPDGAMLITSIHHGTVVELRDTGTMAIQDTITCSHGEIMGLALSPDGRILAVACYDRAVELWDLAARRRGSVLAGHKDQVTAAAFSPDGRLLATSSWDGTAMLWEVATGRQLLTLSGHLRGLFCVAFSPNGTTLATSAWDGVVKLWDPVTGLERMTLRTDARALWCVAFSPDGCTLAAGGRDGMIFLWEAEPEGK